MGAIEAEADVSLSVSISLHVFEERTSAVNHIVRSCGVPGRAVERFVDWYIAAATVLHTTSIATVDDLPVIDRFYPEPINHLAVHWPSWP